MKYSILVTLIVFGTMPWILSRPHVAVLMWSWIGYMNPHRLSWGFAYSFPFAQVIAAGTFVSLIVSREPKQGIPINALTLCWISYLLWMILTTVLALYPEAAQTQLEKVLKIQLITFITIVAITTKERVNQLIWIIVLSLAFYTVKGGVFTIMTGGSFRVWGPSGSFISDNNHLACATLMMLPLMRFLMTTVDNVWIKRGLLISLVLSAVSAVGSQSRGALLAGLAMSVFLWLKSRQKLRTGVALMVILPAILVFMPQSYWDRMGTIFQQDEETGKREASAQSRLYAWTFAYHLANDRIFGGGFNTWKQSVVDRYPPEGDHARAAHSIYFAVLGEHGWPGLLLFLSCIGFTWRFASKIIKQTNKIPHLQWYNELCRMLQVSFIAYCVGGAFLSLAYFDLPWHLMSILIIARILLEKELAINPVISSAVDTEEDNNTVITHPQQQPPSLTGSVQPRRQPRMPEMIPMGKRRSLWKS